MAKNLDTNAPSIEQREEQILLALAALTQAVAELKAQGSGLARAVDGVPESRIRSGSSERGGSRSDALKVFTGIAGALKVPLKNGEEMAVVGSAAAGAAIPVADLPLVATTLEEDLVKPRVANAVQKAPASE